MSDSAKIRKSEKPEQRRYPRVFLTSAIRELHPITDCRVIWPSGFQSDIFDIGRSSISVYLPMRLGLHFTKDQVVRMKYLFGTDKDPLEIEGRVIRGESRLLTLELCGITDKQRARIQKCFDDKHIARRMFSVRKSDFSPEQTFSEWYHGPLDTNLYIYRHYGEIQRITLELGDDVIIWDAHGLMAGPGRDTLSYSTEDYTYYANFLAPLDPIESNDSRVQRAIRFLREIDRDQAIIGEVISRLKM